VQQAYIVIASGDVQGVGFRRVVQRLAREHGLAGEVENLPDGTARIFVQGEDSKIDTFLGKIRLLDSPIKVNNLEKTQTTLNSKLYYFSIKRGDIVEEIDESVGAGLEHLTLMRNDLNSFNKKTDENFQILAKRYDNISETLARVLEQSAERDNELKKSMDALLKSLDALTTLATSYIQRKSDE
jgi:acylphosphatase